MRYILVLMAVIFLAAHPVMADKGPIVWQDNVKLTQESQKAIIMHNGSEEVLILGTEMKADRDAQALEFIPFPSEPVVSLAVGDPFAAISRLITQKGLAFFRSSDFAVKKGHGGAAADVQAVEIRMSRKIGLHDVTTVKINNVAEFKGWCEKFFRDKAVKADDEQLSRVWENARDYTQRGYVYFVFDIVDISRETKFTEPLQYRFASPNIYYPLKTSNLIGGRGSVEVIFLLPGSIMNDLWQDAHRMFDRSSGAAIDLSSSSKVYRRELQPVCPVKDFFGVKSKIYLQVLKYKGSYAFKDDFTYDPAKLKPYGYRFESSKWHGEKEFTPEFTPDEIRDLKEFFCPKSGDPQYIFPIHDYRLECYNFIPSEEYEIYAEVFKNAPSGIPRRCVTLEKMTSRKELKGGKLKLDTALVKDFNDKNRVSHPLENGFPDGEPFIKIADKTGPQLPGTTGKTCVSRVGFNPGRSIALVYVDHIAGPRSGAAYYMVFKKKQNTWVLDGSVMEAMY